MTAQAADILCIDGRRLPLFCNPLEALWDDVQMQVFGHVFAEGVRGTRPRPRFAWGGTANWRGYVATWAIENGQLSLTDIDGEIEVDDLGNVQYGEADFVQGRARPTPATCSASLELLFPGARGRVPAEWFSGELRVPDGNLVEYVHMGYQSIFERELHIRIHRGTVVETRMVNTAEEHRHEEEARQRSLDRVLEARSDEDGWLLCPHCGGKFTVRQKKRWDGERHRCGGRVRLDGPFPD